jgi:tetratricopeptide (TPR) repeat protein
VHSFMLSPDGKTLVTAGADGLVKLWETTRPSKALARQRRIVHDATEAVNQRYRATPAHRDVIAALKADQSLDQEVLRTAIQIADARGDRPRGPVIRSTDAIEASYAHIRKSLDEARSSFAAIVKQASHADFDGVDPNSPEECDGGWVWDANYRLIPGFTLEELDYLLDPLVQQYPEAHQFLCLRGFVNGRKQRWQDAAADFKAALERVPEKTELWTHYAYLLATLYVHQGDFDPYHALRERAMQHALEMDDPHVFELTAKMYLFAGHEGTRVDDAVRLARAIATGVPTDVFRWYSLAAGIAEFRSGNWELAIEILKQAEAPVTSREHMLTATSQLFQTLCYRQLGQHDRANESLSVAEQIMSRPGYGEMDWWNAFIAEAAHKEVRQLFAAETNDAASSSGPDSVLAADRRAERIIPPDSTWKWLHPADGIDPASEDADFHETFFSLEYDDSRWPSATDGSGADGGFGYGDPARVEFDVPAEGDRKTAYFRHHFTTEQAYDDLIVSMQRDDGVIVYLDGQEVGRNNVGDQKESYDLLAPLEVGGAQESWVGFYQLSGTLQPGEHVLAISLHNASTTNPDLRIAEISLWGTPRDAPTDR